MLPCGQVLYSVGFSGQMENFTCAAVWAGDRSSRQHLPAVGYRQKYHVDMYNGACLVLGVYYLVNFCTNAFDRCCTWRYSGA